MLLHPTTYYAQKPRPNLKFRAAEGRTPFELNHIHASTFKPMDVLNICIIVTFKSTYIPTEN